MARVSLLLKGAIAIAVVAAAGLIVIRKYRGGPAEALPDYTAARIVRGDITRAVLTTGQLAPLVTVEISTQISGQITEVGVDFNTQVKPGQVLARIDPATYEQKLNQAKADLAAAEASHHLLELTANRQKELLSRSMTSQSDYDQALAQLQQADAVLLTRKAAVENAQLDLDRCTITSPIDGVVIFKAADVGKTVQASFSAPTLFVIAQDLRKMQIIAPVSEVDIRSVHPGQQVTFTVDAIPDRVFAGTLRQIRNPYTPSDQKSQASATSSSGITRFDAVIGVENPDLVLLPSLTANVSIIIDHRENVLQIPNSALRVNLPGVAVPKGADSVAYRLPGGNREAAAPLAVAVKLGITDSISTEVVSGLAEGDTVVTGVTRTPFQRGSRLFW